MFQSVKTIYNFQLSTVLFVVLTCFSAKAQTLISFFDFNGSMADSVRGASGNDTVLIGSEAYAPVKA